MKEENLIRPTVIMGADNQFLVYQFLDFNRETPTAQEALEYLSDRFRSHAEDIDDLYIQLLACCYEDIKMRYIEEFDGDMEAVEEALSDAMYREFRELVLTAAVYNLPC